MRAPERPLALADLQRRLEVETCARAVPLLVLRIPQFERIAWQLGKRSALRVERNATRAFVESARQCLRAADILGHDSGSDIYVAAMTAPRSAERPVDVPSARDCRGAMERIAAAMSLATDLATLGGWTLLRTLDQSADLYSAISLALERGMRERERYEFFSTVGHELRTPLTSIRGYLETLIDGDVQSAQARGFLETARRETLRLGRLVDTMFEFSLLDVSPDSSEMAGCDVREVAQRACEVVAPAAAARAITIANDVAGALVVPEADAMLAVLVNVLDNAIKYGREGGRVELHGTAEGRFARVMIDDDGPGIAEQDRNRIFGMRQRGDARERPGTGIGLAIVRMIVERAGGEVNASGSPLGGARFELVVPAKAELEPALS